MTPDEYIGHKAYRTVESKRWPPPRLSNGARAECFASWLQHADGTLVFYLRGPIELKLREQDDTPNVPDAVAKDVFGEDCHRCVVQFSYGRLMPNGDYAVRFSTTNRKGRENPWGTLCDACRRDLARDARDAYHKRLKQLGREDGLVKLCRELDVATDGTGMEHMMTEEAAAILMGIRRYLEELDDAD